VVGGQEVNRRSRSTERDCFFEDAGVQLRRLFCAAKRCG
jgi:hypothetical protein